MTELKFLLREWRHYFHMHPETAFEEVGTAAFVAERLREMGIEVQEQVGKTGVVGTLTVGDGKRVIGLRADMDANNITELGNVPYRSQNPGKMHACGHDGHTATLLGAAKLLSERRNFNGTVRFVFQPAEEPGKGARAMLEDGLLERFPMDEIYGLHNSPAVPAGKLGTCKGGFCSSEDNFKVVIRGVGGHASAPHDTRDPLVTASQLVLAFQTIVSRNANPLHPMVISCTELHTDGAHNTIPSTVTILGDTRSYSKEVQRLIEARMRAVSESICQMNGCQCEFQYTHEFSPTINWPEAVDAAVAAGEAVLGQGNVDGNADPIMGSEDFGLYIEKIPGCYVSLGTGPLDSQNAIPLHNARFDYNDDLLLTGAEFFAQLVHDRLS